MNESAPQPAKTRSMIESLPPVQRVSAVLWPSFLLAGLATVVFVALLDPLRLIDYAGEPPLSRTAAYSLGFFCFWLLTSVAPLSTLYFLSMRIPPLRRFDEEGDASPVGESARHAPPRSVDE